MRWPSFRAEPEAACGMRPGGLAHAGAQTGHESGRSRCLLWAGTENSRSRGCAFAGGRGGRQAGGKVGVLRKHEASTLPAASSGPRIIVENGA